MTGSSEIRELGVAEIGLIGDIDRSEHVHVQYAVVDGTLVERPVSTTDIPSWDPVGSDPYSVAAQIAFCEPLIRRGASFLGAFDRSQVCGLVVVDALFEPPMAWLAFLYVSRPHRGRGVASALWDAATDKATAAGATSMYVSAVPTGSAVGFYLSRGCRLASPVHPELYADEPDDIHLICSLR